MITYNDILLKGFVFDQIDIPKNMEEKIWSETFLSSKQGSSVSYYLNLLDSNISSFLIEAVSEKVADEYLVNLIKRFRFDANKMIKEDFMEFHNEVSQKSPVEVIVWLPRDESYEGRDFLMEVNGKVEKFHPKKGSFCLVDTTSLTNRHGVSPLLSDTEIISMVGGLGRKDD